MENKMPKIIEEAVEFYAKRKKTKNEASPPDDGPGGSGPKSPQGDRGKP